MSDENVQQQFCQALRETISSARLNAYRRDPSEPETVILSRYLWNIALCEALYPTLNSLEVVLRNAVNRTLAGYTGHEDWYEPRHDILRHREVHQVTGRFDHAWVEWKSGVPAPPTAALPPRSMPATNFRLIVT